ncbi:MAG: anthranilate synthase component I family protein [Myxococcales bacterium]|nr:anthranilate synthase component I family protein [Myxococcales bacterium]
MWVRRKKGRSPEVLESVFRRVQRLGPYGFWLDSGLSAPDEHRRFWAMGVKPIATLGGSDCAHAMPQFSRCEGFQGQPASSGFDLPSPATLPNGSGNDLSAREWRPQTRLEQLSEFAAKSTSGTDFLPPEVPVPIVVGFLSYEFGSLCDSIPRAVNNPLDAPELFWARYPAVIVGDRITHRVYIFGTQRDSMDALEWAYDSDYHVGAGAFRLADDLSPVQVDTQHQRRVERVLEYIRAGDTYQVNIARRFSAGVKDEKDPVTLFAAIQTLSSAPYAAYMECENATVVSVSPECLVRWYENGVVRCFPIKGTIRRGASDAEDALLKARLLADPKERAEHVMIVDLLRNDLGRVAEYGTVAVPDLCSVHTFAGLHHLISEIRGQLRDGITLGSLLTAVFPGGSVTGAPKVRACEIIAEIECERRGVYCGALGYVDARGGGCLNIPIRTAWLTNQTIHILSGGGIVSDSTPEGENAETWLKIRNWQRVLHSLTHG